MRRLSLVTTVLILWVGSLAHGSTRPPPEVIPTDPQQAKIYHKLRELKITDTKWENIDIETALSEVTQKSKTIDPEHIGIKCILRLDPNKPMTGSGGQPIHRKIQTIILLNETSLSDILGYLTEQTNISYKIEGETVIFSQ